VIGTSHSAALPRGAVSLAVALLTLALPVGCGGHVTPASPVTVSVHPTTAGVSPSGSVGFSATVTGTANTLVLWSVQEASGGTVSGDGLYSAPASPGGPFHVLATSVADASKKGSAAVTVTTTPVLAISPNPASVAVGATQQFTVTPSSAVSWSVGQLVAAPAAPILPLKVSASGRYLVDQNDRPWRIQADAGWLMSCIATAAQVDAYLATRKAQGFNSFYLMAMVPHGGYGSSDAAGAPNHAGVAPFTTPNNFLTPNEPYWAWIDSIVDKAAAQGLVVMLAYNYLGFAGGAQGWASVVSGMTQADAASWGTWLGNRYKSRTNIIWFSCGDYTPPAGSQLERNVVATINAIKAVGGASKLFMTEMNSGSSVPTIESPAIGPLLDMNSFYAYGPSGHGEDYVQADQAYRVSPPRPNWPQETGYEFENNTGGFPSDTSYGTRRSRLWPALAGSTAGDGFGSASAWQWVNVPASFSTPGASYAQKAFAFLATLPWWDLRPSGTGTGFAGKTLVTAGAGTWGGTDAVTSAVTSDGHYLLAYLPGTSGGSSTSSITVDMTALSGSARARWWNPVSGAYTAIGTFPNTGTHAFATPGSNGSGNDWVLLLDTAAGGACGTIDASGLYTAPATVPVGLTCQVTAALQSDGSVTAAVTVSLH
jgi:hypothetical protein